MKKICTRCVMDSEIKGISFDQKGLCNFCRGFYKMYNSKPIKSQVEEKSLKLKKLINDVKKIGKGKKYDCLVGVSGGVDSSWTLIQAKKSGLRPLAVHLDNCWNSELAQNNINNIVSKLNIDLVTHVIDWKEYKDLMQSFFDANVVDIEILYDNSMLALLYKQANKFGLKHIIAGTNSSTEGMVMPQNWNWFKLDKTNIKDIASKNNVRIKSMPIIGVKYWIYCEYIKRIRWVSFPEMFDYKKDKALSILVNEYGYKPYPYKHYESIFTRFYQGYILPRKFNIDKRKLHLSNLIITSQLKRDEALKELESIPYSSNEEMEEDINFFLKKMNWDLSDLENYIKEKRREHYEFKSEKWLYEILQNKIKKFVPNEFLKFFRNSYSLRNE